jgi:hypothetical protein
MRRATIAAVLAASVVLLAGCGEDSTSSAGPSGDPTTTAETTTAPAQTTPAKPTPKPTPRTIMIVVEQGRPRGGIKRPTLEQGEKVVVVVRSDVGDEIHVHGFDVERPLTPGKPVRIPLTAKLPGRFEVELHHPEALLAVLEVRP